MSFITEKKYPITLGYMSPYPLELAKILKINYHRGIDIGMPVGTKILLPVNSVVYEYGNAVWIGNYIIVKFYTENIFNRKTFRYKFYHLSEIKNIWKVGQKMKKETLIALSGNTGLTPTGEPASTGAHLHLELEEFDGRKWQLRNPLMFKNIIR